MVSNRRPFSFNYIFVNRKKSQGAKSGATTTQQGILKRQESQSDETSSQKKGIPCLSLPGIFVLSESFQDSSKAEDRHSTFAGGIRSLIF
jgi:hypothetical protein